MSVSLEKVLNGLPGDRKTRIEERANDLIQEFKTLQELRKSIGLTQAQVASKQGVNQVNVSNFEKRHDMLISTLNSYIHSLGCELQIIIKTPDDRQFKIQNLPAC